MYKFVIVTIILSSLLNENTKWEQEVALTLIVKEIHEQKMKKKQ